jgi:uncharacterized protein
MTLLNYYDSSLLKPPLVAFTCCVGALVVCILLSNDATAQQQQQQQEHLQPPTLNSSQNNLNTLSVTGTATTMVKPDKVIVSLGVETTNKTANGALAANSNVMSKVIDALTASGVKENETSTSSFSISPNYNYSQSSGSTGTITGFTASNSIQIQSINTNNLPKWIDKAISAGANTVNNIDFTLSDEKLKKTKINLIRQAIEDARAKADIAASAAGLKITGVKSINLSEFGTQPSPFPPSPTPSAKESLAAGVTTSKWGPVISGQQQITVNVDVSFLSQ